MAEIKLSPKDIELIAAEVDAYEVAKYVDREELAAWIDMDDEEVVGRLTDRLRSLEHRVRRLEAHLHLVLP